MTFSRLDLDGIGSPTALAKRIHELAPDLPPDFDIAGLCEQLDICSIEEVEAQSFEAVLVMDEHKACGSILLAKGRRPERHRFSIAHELGHFLIPTHLPNSGERMSCSLEDLHQLDAQSQDRHKRIEAQANRFAAALLMPPMKLRMAMTAPEPDLREIVQLARDFGVSKEAMARSYVDAHRESVAVIVLHNRRIDRIYRPDDFPWLEPAVGQTVPADSLAASCDLSPGEYSAIEECDPDVWFGERVASQIDVTTEQFLGQGGGYAMVLLWVEGEEI